MEVNATRRSRYLQCCDCLRRKQPSPSQGLVQSKSRRAQATGGYLQTSSLIITLASSTVFMMSLDRVEHNEPPLGKTRMIEAERETAFFLFPLVFLFVSYSARQLKLNPIQQATVRVNRSILILRVLRGNSRRLLQSEFLQLLLEDVSGRGKFSVIN